MKLIDKEKVIEEINKVMYDNTLDKKERVGMGIAKDIIKNTKDVVSVIAENKSEVIKGKWIVCDKDGNELTADSKVNGKKKYGYKCTNCGGVQKKKTVFCPECGIKMVTEDKKGKNNNARLKKN